MMWNKGYEKSVAGARDPKCSEPVGNSLLDWTPGSAPCRGPQGALSFLLLYLPCTQSLGSVLSFPGSPSSFPRPFLPGIWLDPLLGHGQLRERCCSKNHSSGCSQLTSSHNLLEKLHSVIFFHVNISHFRNVNEIEQQLAGNTGHT